MATKKIPQLPAASNPTLADLLILEQSAGTRKLTLTQLKAVIVDGVPSGGTTGQILAKASDTPFDSEWVDPSSTGLPTMSALVKGGAKLGSGLTMTGEVLSADGNEIKVSNNGIIGDPVKIVDLIEGLLDGDVPIVTATDYILGGVKVGSDMAIEDGVLNPSVAVVSGAAAGATALQSADVPFIKIMVSGAGTTGVNGNYLPDGAVNGKPKYLRVIGEVEYLLSWDLSDLWWAIVDNAGARTYRSSQDVATPDLVTVWEQDEGSLPVPTVTADRAFASAAQGSLADTALQAIPLTEEGGFAAGLSATATTGGAVGFSASTTTGGAVGNSANATYGGAVGESASATSGGAVGESAYATTGGAVGDSATATTGFAGGVKQDDGTATVETGGGANFCGGTYAGTGLAICGNEIADVAGNITGALPFHATNKATLADTDEVAILDSESTSPVNQPKNALWSLVKSTLKTYFDGLYTLANLGGVPTTRTIGGVDLSANRSLADIGAIPEAPSDGKTYGRKDAGWVEAVAGGINTFGITVDGQGSVLTTGSKGFITVPYNCTITNWYLAADQAGDIVFDIKRSGTSIIGAGNLPTLSAAQSSNTDVSGWTSVVVADGDILEFEITGTPATLTRVNLVIKAS